MIRFIACRGVSREGQAKWNLNQEALCAYEGRLLSYELAVRARAAAKRRISQAQHASHMAHGVRSFQKNLDRLGLYPTSDNAGVSGVGGGSAAVSDKESRAAFNARPEQMVLDQHFVPSSNSEAMADLRFRGNMTRRARSEREHRRLKTEVDQRRAKAETDAQILARERLESMVEAGRTRRASAAVYWEKCRAREAKRVRLAASSALRSAEQHSAFERAFEKNASEARKTYFAQKDERDAAMRSLASRLQSSSDRKRQRIEGICRQIVLKLSDLAIASSEERAERGGRPLPPTTWNNMIRRFHSTESFFHGPTTPAHVVSSANSAQGIDATFQANVSIQLRNFDRFEGLWRLPPGSHDAPLPLESPLDAVLSVARDVMEAGDSGPREPPDRLLDYLGINGEGDAVRNLSVKLVILACGDGPGEVDGILADFGRWTGLYCCRMDAALDHAFEVGASVIEAAAKSASTSKRQKSGSTSGGDGAPNAGPGDHHDPETVTADESDSERQDDAMIGAFHPDAREEDVASFKEAAAAYHALCSKAEQGARQASPTIRTDILVKHLACRAPPGHGWVLIDYPRTLLEAKLLENALTGLVDSEVAAEVAAETKPAAKSSRRAKKKDSVGPPLDTPKTAPRSGLDAVLRLATGCSRETTRDPEDADRDDGCGEEGQGPGPEPTGRSPEKTEARSVEGREGTSAPSGHGPGEGAASPEAPREVMQWWSTFEGGCLACDVPEEASGERLVETLYLLAILAQERKVSRVLRTRPARPWRGSAGALPRGRAAP